MTQEEKEILQGNILISRYLFGEPIISGYYQIGYKSGQPWYRTVEEMCCDDLYNFNNDWRLLMIVITRIAKDDYEQFSKEEIYIDELKNTIFHFAEDPMMAWFIVCKYIRLKLTV